MDGGSFTFSWDVKNFSLCTHSERFLMQSDVFIARMLNDTKWEGLFYPWDFDPNFMSIYMKRLDPGTYLLGLRATLQLIAADGTYGNEITQTNMGYTNGFNFPKFVSRSEVKLYLHKDTLKIQCILRKINQELTTKSLLALSTINIRKINRGWALTNFSQMKQGIVFRSMESLRLQEGGVLGLEACLSFIERQSGGLMNIEFIRRCDPQGKPMILTTQMTVMDAQETETEISKQDQHVFHMRTREEVWQFPTFINTDPILRQKNKYLANDVLKLKCDITIHLGTVSSEIKKTWFTVKKNDIPSVDEFTEDMKDLFHSKRFADVKLCVSGKMVPAHRIVLQLRSKRFTEMLENVERTDSVLDVSDVDIMTLNRMLKYMYTDEIDDLEYDELEVAYTTAHKYRIESLKCKYSFVLVSHLKVSNACKILILAVDFCDEDMKKCTVKFINQYWDRVRLSKEWEKLSRERELLAKMTMEQLSNVCRSTQHKVLIDNRIIRK